MVPNIPRAVADPRLTNDAPQIQSYTPTLCAL